MLGSKKDETTTIIRRPNWNVIFVFSIAISLLNGCIQIGVATEEETGFDPEHVEKSCVEKCPNQDTLKDSEADINVTSSDKPEVVYDSEPLKLIIVSKHHVLMQGSNHFYEQPNFVYNSSKLITGVGIDVAKKLLFIIDETSSIFKASLSNSSVQSKVRIYPTDDNGQIPLELSVDWLNNKLYILFENNSTIQSGKQISRCNFDGSQMQALYSRLKSKPVHFQVDPYNGYIFWSMDSTSKNESGLFRLDLNDIENETKPTLIFSQNRIGVFAIDYITYKIFVPIDGMSTVISIDLNGDKIDISRKNTQTSIRMAVKSFTMANSQFYWTSADGAIMEEYHKMSKYYNGNLVTNFGKLSNFSYVYVNLPSAQPTPKPSKPPNNVKAVLNHNRAEVSWYKPDLLNNQSRGAWQDWIYELEITNEDDNNTKRTISQIKPLQITVLDLRPQTMYRFRVAAYTCAGYSPYSLEFRSQTLKTPSHPDLLEPLRPRIFVSHMYHPIQNGHYIETVFRWNPPKSGNVAILGYKIYCWYEKQNLIYDLFIDYFLPPEINEKYMGNLPKNVTLHCKVKSETYNNEGSFSSLASMNTHIEKPIPRLLASANEGIYIFDFDLKRYSLIVNDESRVNHFCFIAFSKQFFWTNTNNELMSYSRENKERLLLINAPVLSLTVDWIEQILYWVQTEMKGSSINTYNLNTKKSNFVLQSSSFMINLNVAPLNRELFWIESEFLDSTRSTLASYHFGSDHSSLFRDAENAPVLITQNMLFLDTFTEGHEEILWLNEFNQLISTDIRLRTSKPSNFTYHSNMMNMVRDSSRIYWTQHETIFAENPPEQVPLQQKFFYPMKILPISRQSYPPIECLLPQRHFDRKDHLYVYDSSDRSLWLHLPVPTRLGNCSFHPTFLKYHIIYTEVKGDNWRLCSPKTCNMAETTEQIIEITNLKPYTKYQFQIGISNYYSGESNMNVKYTRGRVFQTEIGTPSRPRNVSAQILSSTELVLSWISPEEINGPSIRYEVEYQTENKIDGYKNTLKLPITDDNVNSINITELLPNQSYIIWVKSYTTDASYNQSDSLKITTPQSSRIKNPNSSIPKSLSIDVNNGSLDRYLNDRPYILIAVIGTSTIVVLAVIFNSIICVFKFRTSDARNLHIESVADAESEHEYAEIDI